MTRRPASSFLVRLESGRPGTSEGTVTSVATGERASFASLPEMARIIERWSTADVSPQNTEEADP